MREYIPVVLRQQACGRLFQQPREVNTKTILRRTTTQQWKRQPQKVETAPPPEVGQQSQECAQHPPQYPGQLPGQVHA